MAGITSLRSFASQERFFLVLPILYSSRIGWLGCRRGWANRQWVEDRIDGKAWCGFNLRLRYRRGLLRKSNNYKRSAAAFKLACSGLPDVVAPRKISCLDFMLAFIC